MVRILLVLLLIPALLHAQIDPQKLDSLQQSIEASTRATKAWQDSFQKTQDSIYRKEVLNRIQEEKNAIGKEILNRKEKESEKDKTSEVAIVLAAAVLAIGLIMVLRKRRMKRG